MHPNTIRAWNQIVGTLTPRQRVVLEALRATGPATMHDVAKYLKVELNRISGRFGELAGTSSTHACDPALIYGIPGPDNRTIWHLKDLGQISSSKPHSIALFTIPEL